MTFKKPDEKTRVFLSWTISAALNLGFSVYYGFLGIFRHSLWHGSMAAFCLLLTVVRVLLLLREKDELLKKETAPGKSKTVYYVNAAILLFTNLAMLTPAGLMIRNERPVSLGMIPAIAVAVYTVYKITTAIASYKKNRVRAKIGMRQAVTFDLLDAIMSVLTLQNTLILVSSGEIDDTMRILCSITSLVAVLVGAAISILSFARLLREDLSEKKKA